MTRTSAGPRAAFELQPELFPPPAAMHRRYRRRCRLNAEIAYLIEPIAAANRGRLEHLIGLCISDRGHDADGADERDDDPSMYTPRDWL